jgi:chaperonin GroES
MTNHEHVRPLHDHILAKRLPDRDKTEGGLVIPDSAKERPLEALVVAVGAGKTLEDGRRLPLSVKPGDEVLIAKYSGSVLQLGKVEHIMLREDDVLAILERSS